jgi:asparagine synthase (glutamine-hydrolysing)
MRSTKLHFNLVAPDSLYLHSMCGISGFFDKVPNRSTLATLRKMSLTLVHRGPDGGDEIFEQNAQYESGLAHRRLSIIDLSNAASQPMTYKHLTIVFNGEIYNYKEIKEILITDGHVFNTNSDTEVLLHAFEAWGLNMVQQLVGMFAICIVDKNAHKVFFIRDRAGSKPLYYYCQDGLFLFASELKALLAHQSFNKEINLQSMQLYLQFGNVPDSHCIWKDTFKLNPGCSLSLDLKTFEYSVDRYWDSLKFANSKHLEVSYEEALSTTELIIQKACNYRMVADVPVGTFLSGGYDSTLVVSLLQSQSSTKLNTYTIGFRDSAHDEAPAARAIAKHLGSNHTEIYCDQNKGLELIEDLSYYYDEPFADSSAIPTMLVSKLARQHVTVALSADAGDEVFLGYNKYSQGVKLWEKMTTIPTFLRPILASTTKKFAHLTMNMGQVNLNTKLNRISHAIAHANMQGVNVSLSSHFFPDEIERLLLQTSSNRISTNYELNIGSANILEYLATTDYVSYLPNDILHKVDRATMSASLEGREPLLDHTIQQWAAQLPLEYKYNKGTKKRILKDIVHKYVPADLLTGPKRGFGVPIAQWLRSDLAYLIERYMAPTFIAKQDIFDSEEIDKLRSTFQHSSNAKADKIWIILSFQMWWERWAS